MVFEFEHIVSLMLPTLLHKAADLFYLDKKMFGFANFKLKVSIVVDAILCKVV